MNPVLSTFVWLFIILMVLTGGYYVLYDNTLESQDKTEVSSVQRCCNDKIEIYSVNIDNTRCIIAFNSARYVTDIRPRITCDFQK